MANTPNPRYQYIKSQISEAEDEITSARSTILRNEALIALLRSWAEELRQLVCHNCDGYGLVKVWLAQDDVHVEKCPECKGTGTQKGTKNG